MYPTERDRHQQRRSQHIRKLSLAAQRARAVLSDVSVVADSAEEMVVWGGHVEGSRNYNPGESSWV